MIGWWPPDSLESTSHCIVYMRFLCFLCSYSMPCYIDTKFKQLYEPQKGWVVIELYLMLLVFYAQDHYECITKK